MDHITLRKKRLIGFTLVLMLFACSISLTYYVARGAVESGGTYYLDIPFGTASYYVGKFSNGSTWMVNGDTWRMDAQSTDDDLIIQYAIDNTTSDGGTVFVKAASYSASVTLKDNVMLVLEKGVTGVTVTIDGGADCTLIDEENGFRKEYVSGSLYSFMDWRSGEFWYGSENRTDLVANPTGVASYIVETDGTNTWMTNCSTGQRDVSSTNASAIFNWASSNASAVKGSIFVKSSGDSYYDFTHPVLLHTNTLWDGEGYGSHLRLADNRPTSDNEYWVQHCIFLGSESIENVTIWNLRFDGNYLNNLNIGSIVHETGNIFTNNGGKHIQIKNCWIENHRRFGADLRSWGGDLWDVTIKDCTFYNNQWNGLTLGTSTSNEGYLNRAVHNYFAGTHGDIALNPHGESGGKIAQTILLDGNIINGMTGQNGSSWVDGGDGIQHNADDEGAWYGIRMEGSGSCIITNNIIRNVRVGIMDDSVGTGNHTVTNNKIYLKDCVNVTAQQPYGIHFAKGKNIISTNVIVGSDDLFGAIRVGGNTVGLDGYNIVTNNIVIEAVGEAWVYDYSGYNTWIGNDLAGCTIWNWVSATFNETATVKYNIGFVTENSGTAINSTATTFVFNHGLAKTPTGVWASFNTTAISGWIWTATTTQITITVSGTSLPEVMAVYWKAEYVP